MDDFCGSRHNSDVRFERVHKPLTHLPLVDSQKDNQICLKIPLYEEF